MTRKNINDAVNLTSWLYELPPAGFLVVAMFFVGVVAGVVTQPAISGILKGLLFFSAPALLSSAIIHLMLRKSPYRRVAATSLAAEIVYATAYVLGSAVYGGNPIIGQAILLIGSALVFVLWYLIARFVFILRFRAVIFAILQLLFYLVFLIGSQSISSLSEISGSPFIINSLNNSTDAFGVITKFYLSALVLLSSVSIFLFIINAPMKKNLGVASTDALSWFFSQWLYHNKDMEKAFIEVGEQAKTIVSTFAFKRKNDTIIFLTPHVHFGPFGNLGGSEFSFLLADELARRNNGINGIDEIKTFVFHGTVTHDLNPVSSLESEKILSAVETTLKNANMNKQFFEVNISFVSGRFEECKAQCLRFGESALFGLSRAPALTEDINFGVGLALISVAEKKVQHAMMIDQHNSETGEITSFEPGSIAGHNYFRSVEDAVSKFKTETSQPLRMGVSFQNVDAPNIGKAGIKIAVFGSSPEYVLILIDANGITPGFRDSIEERIKQKAPVEVGIYTTDTHAINMVRGVLNPLKDEKDILARIEAGYMEASTDMQDATFYQEKQWIDIKVIGAKQSIELISTVNSIVAISKITFPLFILAAILVIVAIVGR